MADVNLHVKITKDDTALKELAASLASVFGGATSEKAKASAKALTDAVVSQSKEAGKQQVQAAQQTATAISSAQDSVKAATERRIKFEKQAEEQKYEAAKEKYKELVTAHQNMTTAMQEATSKEVKAELKERIAELKAEKQAYADNIRERKETKQGKSSDVGMLGTKREVSGSGGGLLQVAGIGAAVEGFKMLTEKTNEVAAAQKQLATGTGLSGEALAKQRDVAKEVGASLLVSANDSAAAMGKVASFTHSSGEELKTQTEAVLAYGLAHGKSGEAVAKLMATERGRAKVFSEAQLNIAKAQLAANDPAQKAIFIQQQLTEKAGDLALVVLNALGPALTAIMPLIDSVGKLIESVVKPAMDALTPVMVVIADAFKKLAPVISNLIEGGMKLLAPIVEALSGMFAELIPVIIDAVKVVGDALTPVFAALTPIIKTVGTMLKDGLGEVIKGTLVPVLQLLTPILTGVLVPILMALMPLLQMVADLVSAVLTPTLKLLSGILQFIVTNAIQPLVKWMGGELTTAINATVGVITKAVGAITSVVGSITSFLGMGDKAAAATKDAGGKVIAAEKENADAARVQMLQEDAKKQGDRKTHFAQMLKIGKLSAADEAEMRQDAEDNEDQITLAKLDAYDKKKEAQAAKGGKAAAKAVHDAKKAEIDQELADEKDRIAALDITDREAKALSRTAEIKHRTDLRDIFAEGSKEYIRENHKLQAILIGDGKQDRADALALAQQKTADALTQAEINADNQNLTAKELEKTKYTIQLKGLDDQLALVKKGSEEESKLLQQRAAMVAKHGSDERAANLAIQKEIESNRLSQRKDEIAALKEKHASAQKIQDAETQLAFDEEDARWKEEQEKRGGDMNANHALRESLEANHQNKLLAIQQKAYADQKALDQQKISWLTGPLANAFTNVGDSINTKFFTPFIEKSLGGKNVFSGFISEIIGGLIKTGVTILTQYAANLAASIAFGTASAAAATATNTAILATAAPAAAAESIATFGGAAAAGGSSLLATMGAVVPAMLTLIPHAEGGITNRTIHAFGEAGPEAIIPLASSRAQGQIGAAFGFDKALAPLHQELQAIRVHTGQTQSVLPVNSAFENARNNYRKSVARSSF